MLLGALQGLTEFLPVSSSGHLVLGGVVLGLKEPHLLFDVLLHVATLLATLLFYRDALREILIETWAALRAFGRRPSLVVALDGRPAAKLALLIVVGSVPTGIVGITFKDALAGLFSEPRAAAAMLLLTALILVGTRFVGQGEGRGIAGMGVRDALLIGLVQGFAIVPGISRSGSTIACALFLGVERELAARYSFLLSVPAIMGALLLQLKDGGAAWSGGAAPLLAGFAAAAVVGIGALALLIPLVRRGRLHYFAFYLIPVGLAALFWLP